MQKAAVSNSKFNFSSKLRSAKSILFTPALPNILKNTSVHIDSDHSERSNSSSPIKYNLKSTTQRTTDLLQKIENQKKRLKVCIPSNRSVCTKETQNQYFNINVKPSYNEWDKANDNRSNRSVEKSKGSIAQKFSAVITNKSEERKSKVLTIYILVIVSRKKSNPMIADPNNSIINMLSKKRGNFSIINSPNKGIIYLDIF